MEHTCNAEEFLAFIQNPILGVNRLIVEDDILLPQGIEELPEVPTIYKGKFNAAGTSLKNFNADAAQKLELGSTFGLNRVSVGRATMLDLNESRVRSIRGDIHWLSIIGCPNLRKLGAGTHINHITLGIDQLPLLLQLREPPHNVYLRHSAKPTSTLREIDEVTSEDNGWDLKEKDVDQLILYIRLITQPVQALLPRYNKIIELDNFLDTAPMFLMANQEQPKKMRQLKADLQQRLTLLAQRKIRSHTSQQKPPPR